MVRREDSVKPSYPCLSPGCEAQFPQEALLEQHMACHFEQSLEINSDGGPYSRHYSNLNSEDCHEAIDAASGLAPSSRTSVSLALDSGPIRNGSANAKKKYNCLEHGCYKGFDRLADFARHGKTHYATGRAKEFDCPELGCNRQGEWGFMRRDKLVDHIRAKHKRSVGRDEFRKPALHYYLSEKGRKRNDWLAAHGLDFWGEPIRDVSNKQVTASSICYISIFHCRESSPLESDC